METTHLPDTDPAPDRDALDSWADSADLVGAYLRRCPARDILAVLADKWVLLVLGTLRAEAGPVRFNELRRRLDGITQKMLTQTLRTLERDGLVRRAVYPTVPPRVEYTLTELGADLGKLTHALGTWSLLHLDEIHTAREQFDERLATAPQPL
ncbi:winged helix-turn-helix transcriptional regulator [Nocardia sp. alder85J]|uniref:winged helix-turn-helix transcriptional regulator n=1 Tax=Nocardia sp. alder85J TaxID=2862949 RepID=UPI001CD1A08E|nr:helix-turn-helix domain-containing protein [Nocardia sp. alder85J]MCX4096149.1 helix-turn-helix domain-containing protein [Nocardia sp. alder85J]